MPFGGTPHSDHIPPYPGIGVRGPAWAPWAPWGRRVNLFFYGFFGVWSGFMTFLTLLTSFLVKELLKLMQ